MGIAGVVLKLGVAPRSATCGTRPVVEGQGLCFYKDLALRIL